MKPSITVETAGKGCSQCHKDLGFEFSFAFQPIVNVREARFLVMRLWFAVQKGKGRFLS